MNIFVDIPYWGDLVSFVFHDFMSSARSDRNYVLGSSLLLSF